MIIEYTVTNVTEKDGTELKFEAEKWEQDMGNVSNVDVRPILQSASREYGDCVSRVVHKGRMGQPRVIGWVFAKQDEGMRVETCVRFLEGCPHCGGTGKIAVGIG